MGDLDWLPLKSPARAFLKKMVYLPKKPWSEVYPQVGSSTHEALEAMLNFHPHHRIDAVAALELSYFETVWEERDFVVNCHESDSENVQCTTLGGDLIGAFHVPEGEQTFDGWLAKKVAAANPDMLGTLNFLNPAGEVFCSQYFEEGSEPIEEPVDWIFDKPCLTKESLQTEVQQELRNFRPWIVETDRQ